MKTIKQIADEIGVSKQAVFYRIYKPPLSNALQSFISKIDGVLMVEFDGETLIKQAFSKITVKDLAVKEASKENTNFDGDSELYRILKAELEAKNAQIMALQAELAEERKHSREQADKLTVLADQAQQLHAGTIIDTQKLIESGEKRWWQFWKNGSA